MGWAERLVWTAVIATLFCLSSIVTGILDLGANIWIPLGLAGVTFAIMDSRVER